MTNTVMSAQARPASTAEAIRPGAASGVGMRPEPRAGVSGVGMRPEPRAGVSGVGMRPEPVTTRPAAGEVNVGVDVPVPMLGVHRVHVGVPPVLSPQAAVAVLAHAATAAPRAVWNNRPSRDQLVFYGGLGALAAFEALSWPVAAAIGAGVWVASRARVSAAEAQQ